MSLQNHNQYILLDFLQRVTDDLLLMASINKKTTVVCFSSCLGCLCVFRFIQQRLVSSWFVFIYSAAFEFTVETTISLLSRLFSSLFLSLAGFTILFSLKKRPHWRQDAGLMSSQADKLDFMNFFHLLEEHKSSLKMHKQAAFIHNMMCKSSKGFWTAVFGVLSLRSSGSSSLYDASCYAAGVTSAMRVTSLDFCKFLR